MENESEKAGFAKPRESYIQTVEEEIEKTKTLLSKFFLLYACAITMICCFLWFLGSGLGVFLLLARDLKLWYEKLLFDFHLFFSLAVVALSWIIYIYAYKSDLSESANQCVKFFSLFTGIEYIMALEFVTRLMGDDLSIFLLLFISPILLGVLALIVLSFIIFSKAGKLTGLRREIR
jgi:hypothetical protein